MRCENCGKELTYICDLSEEQLFDMKYIESINQTLCEETPKIYKQFDILSDEEIMECLEALSKLRVKLEFLRYKLNKEIKDNNKLLEEQFNNMHIFDYKVYC